MARKARKPVAPLSVSPTSHRIAVRGLRRLTLHRRFPRLKQQILV